MRGNGSMIAPAAMPAGDDTAGQGGLPLHLQTHIGPLDGLRGLAAMLVVFSHMHLFGLKPLFDTQIGNYGVFLFFVLSGFLMGHLYLTRRADRKELLTYFAARISRIVPIYYIVVFVSFFYARYIDSNFVYAMSITELFKHLAFVGNVSVFWSIGPEFQFYFIFPIIWWIAGGKSQNAVMYGIAAVFVILTVFLFRSEWPGTVVLSKLHIFIAGITLGIIRPLINKVIDKKSATFLQILSVIIILSLFLPKEIIGHIIFPDTHGDIKKNIYYSDFSKLFLLCFVVIGFSFPTKFAESVMENRFTKMVGKYSFSVYLLHVPVFYAFQHLGLSDLFPYFIIVPMLVATILFISALSFHLLEDPIRIVARIGLMRLFGLVPHSHATPAWGRNAPSADR